jgi:hypothetical protein
MERDRERERERERERKIVIIIKITATFIINIEVLNRKSHPDFNPHIKKIDKILCSWVTYNGLRVKDRIELILSLKNKFEILTRN